MQDLGLGGLEKRRVISGCLRAGGLSLGLIAAFIQPSSAADRALTLTPLYQFPAVADGEAPWCTLVAYGKLLYGTTFEGGAFGRGSVFSIDPSSGAEKLVYSFENAQDATLPMAGVTLVGKTLYGVSNEGGAYGNGAVYSVNPITGAEKVIFSLTPDIGGGSGSNLVYSGGMLYGESYSGSGANQFGVIFGVNIKTGVGKIIYAFTGGADGGNPQTGITLANGVIYGTATQGGTGGGGTLFAVKVATGAETTLHSFTYGADGGDPNGGVIDVGGVLYGAAGAGGASGAGAVFAYSLATQAFSTIHSFAGGSEGLSPLGPLTDVGGTLYGTAYSGGAGYGTVYAVNAASGQEQTLYSFPGGAGGAYPEGGVTDVNNTLYVTGTGFNTPGLNIGAVDSISLASGASSILHSFQGNLNVNGNSGLLSVGGKLYGVAAASPAAPYGSLYSFSPATGVPTTLYTFTGGADGGGPVSVTNIGGVLYGTARLGGANGVGGVFSFTPSTGKGLLLASFPSGFGGPVSAVTASGGLLYGTTELGGANFVGTIFSFDPGTAAFATVYSFGATASDGLVPNGGLIADKGVLYGATFAGGAGYGTVFSYAIAKNRETVLHGFSGSDGNEPSTPVLDKGTLYGATVFGGSSTCFGTSGCGVLYSVGATGKNFTVLHTFTQTTDGAEPGGLVVAGGVVYGGTYVGGSSYNGTLFGYDPAAKSFDTLYAFTGNQDGNGGVVLTDVGSTIYGVGGAGTYWQGVLFSLTGY